jgi:signal transduction histidine kinase
MDVMRILLVVLAAGAIALAVVLLSQMGRRRDAEDRARLADDARHAAEAQQAKLQARAEAAEKALAVERHRFNAVFNAVPFGIILADAANQSWQINPAGRTIMQATVGIPIDSPQSLPPYRIYCGGRQLSQQEEPIYRALRGETLPAEEYETLFNDGRRADIMIAAAPLRQGGKDVDGAVVAFVDITPMKKLQRELQIRRRDAEEMVARRSRFLATVSHDIRTPANAISLLAELIQNVANNPDEVKNLPDYVAELRNSANSLVQLVSAVLDLSRLDAGKTELLDNEIDLVKLVDEECRHLQPLAANKGLEFKWASQSGGVRVRGDRIKLGRVLGNLISNAIKFTDKGFVHVTMSIQPEGSVKLEVKDTGCGIDPEQHERIFDEFSQARRRDQHAGTGLGLSIAKRLVELMGGSIHVQSEKGSGSTFTLTLPKERVVS